MFLGRREYIKSIFSFTNNIQEDTSMKFNIKIQNFKRQYLNNKHM